MNEQSLWPYRLTGNFVVKSVVDSDTQVNGGTDADPKKRGAGGYGLQFGLKIGKGPECEPTSSPDSLLLNLFRSRGQKRFVHYLKSFQNRIFDVFNIDT